MRHFSLMATRIASNDKILTKSSMSLEKACFFATYSAGFIGATPFEIELGNFTLFPFRILILGSWFILLLSFFAGKAQTFKNLLRIKRYIFYLIIWLIYAVFSFFWVKSTTDAIRNLSFLIMGSSVIFLTCYYSSAEKDLKTLYYIWVGAFYMMLLLGMWENITARHLSVSGYSAQRIQFAKSYIVEQVRRRPTGVFNNPNDYATFIAISIPFVLALARYSREKIVRICAIVGITLGGYLIIATGSRGNLVALLLELVFFWLFIGKGFNKFKWLFVVGILLILIISVFPPVANLFFRNVEESISSLAYESPREGSSISIRWNLAKNGMHFLYSTYGFGVGAGNLEYWMEHYPVYYTRHVLNIHNWWLEILTNYGVAIFVGFVLFYIGIIRGLWSAHCAEVGIVKIVSEALLVSTVGFSVASISSSSVMAIVPIWSLFGFSLAVIALTRNENLEYACNGTSI